MDENGRVRLKNLCKHWQKTENGARCNLLNEEHFRLCGWHLVWDQVKECGINKKYSQDDDEDTPHQETTEERSARLIREGYKFMKETCRCGKEVEFYAK